MRQFYLFFVVLIIILFNTTQSFNNNRHNYNNGLMFYDLKTNKTLLPPVVSSENFSRNPFGLPSFGLPNFGMPCSCETLNCGCCAGMNFLQFNNHREYICIIYE